MVSSGLRYNLRSLLARKVGSLMTVFGIGIVVWASVFAFGLSGGLDKTLASLPVRSMCSFCGKDPLPRPLRRHRGVARDIMSFPVSPPIATVLPLPPGN